MARRKLFLPGIHELSKEQDDALSLPRKGQHLIIGGPGTGKSVLALLRCRSYALDRKKYIFLVYNHLLHQASRQLFGITLESRTWITWFKKKFSAMCGKPVPLKPSAKPWDIDWDNVLKIITEVPPTSAENLPYLIIDEGQDMPPQFYQALVALGFENFYVVADQNQQIARGKNSSRQDIEDELNINSEDIIELTLNYRNTFGIARLAREFYSGDPASPPPRLPEETSNITRPVLYEYGGCGKINFLKVIERILKMADRNPGKLIGIITPDNEAREHYCNSLKSINVRLDQGRPQITTYCSGQKLVRPPFDQGGIMVINAKACKGLEFDTVFLADLEKYQLWPEILDERKKLLYVMISRASKRIILLRNANSRYFPLQDILPENSKVLERR